MFKPGQGQRRHGGRGPGERVEESNGLNLVTYIYMGWLTFTQSSGPFIWGSGAEDAVGWGGSRPGLGYGGERTITGLLTCMTGRWMGVGKGPVVGGRMCITMLPWGGAT